MTSDQRRLRAFMERCLVRYRRLSPGQVELSGMRVLQQLRKNAEWQRDGLPSELPGGSDDAIVASGFSRTSAAVVTATLIGVIAVTVVRQVVIRRDTGATIEVGRASLQRSAAAESIALKLNAGIPWGGVVRSDDVDGCTLALPDGSKVEMRARAQLALERAPDGVRISLGTGSIIVTAAKQPHGHLYVQTRDVTVSVVGTVFLVSAEEDGSRVAVIEGVVRVREKDGEKSLRSGEQVSTSTRLEPRAVKDEIAWSHNAVRHLSLLAVSVSAAVQQAPLPTPAPPPAGPTPQSGGTTSTPPASGRGGNPNAAIGSPSGIVNPSASDAALSAPNLGTSTISGIVTDAATGAPLEGALVSLFASGLPGEPLVNRPPQMTDSKGRFIFPRLAASKAYSLRASRPGFLNGGYQMVPGRPGTDAGIKLADGEWMREANVKLWRPAAISGMVRDERGEPFVGVPVRMLLGTIVAGRWRWAGGPVTQTDDRGVYRFGGLAQGRYLVQVPSIQITLPSGEVALYHPPAAATTAATSAPAPPRDVLHVMREPDGSGVVAGVFAQTAPDDRGSVYASVFHPAARSIDEAEPIALGFGAERTSVDIFMTPLPSVSVSGTVVGPPDAVAGVPVRIAHVGNELLGQGGDAGLTTTDAAGRFTFHRIPAGDYAIVASTSVADFRMSGAEPGLMPQDANPLNVYQSLMPHNGLLLALRRVRGRPDVTGRLQITVGNHPVSGLVIPVQSAVSVSGYFEWDGSETPPAALPLSLAFIGLEPADDVTLGEQLAVRTNGSARREFTFENVMPGRYVFGNVEARLPRPDSPFPVPAYWLVGATWNGRDIIDAPLEVSGDGPVTGIVLRMSSKTNKLTGTVRGQDGRLATEAVVIAFPPLRAAWMESGLSAVRFRTAAVAPDGTYEFPTMIPGDYLLAAVPAEDQARRVDPEFLASISRAATRMSVGVASTLTQDLRLLDTSGGQR